MRRVDFHGALHDAVPEGKPSVSRIFLDLDDTIVELRAIHGTREFTGEFRTEKDRIHYYSVVGPAIGSMQRGPLLRALLT